MGEGELEETQKEVEQELAELDDGQPQVRNVSIHSMVYGVQFSYPGVHHSFVMHLSSW